MSMNTSSDNEDKFEDARDFVSSYFFKKRSKYKKFLLYILLIQYLSCKTMFFK